MTEVSDFSEGKSSEGLDLERYLNIARRRHVHFLLSFLIGWLAVWAISWVLPARYKSTTLILVEQPSMPKDYVAPNVTEDLQDRLQSITQQILSRTRLLSIIDKLQLYRSGRTQVTPDEKVELMRKDISIDLVRSENAKGISGFTIGYSSKDPQTAQRVTSELTDLFIDENLKARQQESEDTTAFIQNQLDTARTVLAEQEAAVRQYEGKHIGELPSQQASNLQILSGLQGQLQNELDALNNAKQQGIYYQSLIEQYRALRGTPRAPDGDPTDLPVTDKELEVLRQRFASLSARYTDRYPDVIRLKEEIAKTEKMRDDLLAGLRSKGTPDTRSNSDSAADGAGSPQQSPAMLQLEGQVRANHAEVANREQAVAALKARVNEYQSRLNSEPAREQELADLTRGYEQSKANYDDLLKKKNASEMATSMEQMQQGERFKMLDPPSLPIKPDSPNRMKMCGIGLVVGLGMGLVVVMLFELIDDRMHAEREIKGALSVPLVSEIPVIAAAPGDRSGPKKRLLGWAMTVLVLSCILAGSAFSYLHG